MSSTATTPHSTHVLKNRIAELEAENERLEGENENLKIGFEIEAAALAVQIARLSTENDRLRADRADRQKEVSKRDQELYELWLTVHQKDPAKKVNLFGPAARRALTRARKTGLDQDDMAKIVRTHARFPFLVFGHWKATGKPIDRKDKLADAFRDEGRWNELLELADAPIPSPHVPQRREEHFIGNGQSPVQNLYAALERNECRPWLASGGQGSANCPIHDDREKSFRFKEKSDGSVLMHCLACSSGFVNNQAFCEQVRIDLEIPIHDLYPNQKGVA